jgi:hypothetical protein
VSRVPRATFSGDALQASLNDHAWFKSTVRSHNHILSAIQQQGPLIPMRFCTICYEEDSLRDFLAENHEDFVATLGIIEGKQEWGVKLYCDEEKLFRLTEMASDRVRQLRADSRDALAVARRELQRRLQEVIAREADALRTRCVQHSHDVLTAHAEETVVNPLLEDPYPERKERLVHNAAYLIPDRNLPAFKNTLERFQKDYRSLRPRGGVGRPSAAPAPGRSRVARR